MNAGDVVAGPDGRTYLVLGVRPGNGLRALERMQAPPPLLTWLRQRPALGTRYDALRCAAEIVRVHYPAAPEIGGAP